jgi:hypothetical protein
MEVIGINCDLQGNYWSQPQYKLYLAEEIHLVFAKIGNVVPKEAEKAFRSFRKSWNYQ